MNRLGLVELVCGMFTYFVIISSVLSIIKYCAHVVLLLDSYSSCPPSIVILQPTSRYFCDGKFLNRLAVYKAAALWRQRARSGPRRSLAAVYRVHILWKQADFCTLLWISCTLEVFTDSGGFRKEGAWCLTEIMLFYGHRRMLRLRGFPVS